MGDGAKGSEVCRGEESKLSMLGVAGAGAVSLGLRSHQLTAPQPGWLPLGALYPEARRGGASAPRRWEASARGPGLCDSRRWVYTSESANPLPRAWTSRPPRPCPSAPPPRPFLASARHPQPPPASSCEASATWNHLQVTFRHHEAGWAPPPGALPSQGVRETPRPIPGHRAAGPGSGGGPLPRN